MPPRATDLLLGDTSAPGRCWARQESGDLIGTCGQRRLNRCTPRCPENENHGFIALGLMPAGQLPPQSGTDPEEFPRPALPCISLPTALGSLPSVALSSADRRITQGQGQSNSTTTSPQSEHKFGASAPGASPPLTGAARTPATARETAAVFHFEWIASGFTAVCFWTALRSRWAGIAALEGWLRFSSPGLRSARLSPNRCLAGLRFRDSAPGSQSESAFRN